MDSRRIIYYTSLGALMYMFMAMVSQTAMGSSLAFMTYFTYESDGMIAFLEGLIMNVSVLFSAILLWLYATDRKNKGQLFTEDAGVGQTVFGRNSRMGLIRLLLFAAFMFSTQMVAQAILQVLELVLNSAGYTAMQSPSGSADYSGSITLTLYAVFIGPAVEELVYRGFVLKALKPCGKVFAIAVSALMFGLMHGDIQQLVFTTLAGVILGYAAMEYSIFASYLLHVINNGVFSELLLYIGNNISETAYFVILTLLGISGAAVLIWFLAKKLNLVRQYIRENASEPGVVRGLKNRWFIIFVVIFVMETLLTISPNV